VPHPTGACLAARQFSAEIGLIHLDLSPQHVSVFPRSLMARWKSFLCSSQACVVV